ncbi:MAG: hypothetical protein JST54_35520 [Deltaproteobacteria bacterium]|nr:hypothetical protein [Deltaproteobacteria bacterium]
MVALLLERGGDPNIAESEFGSYPVHFALDRKAPILRALLEGGARANVKDSLGFTPAMRSKRKDIRALLARKPMPRKKSAGPDLGPLFAEARGLKKKVLSGVPVAFLKKSSRALFDECDLSPHAFPELHPIGDLSGRLLVVDGSKAPLPVLVFDEGEFTRLAPSWKAFVAKLR